MQATFSRSFLHALTVTTLFAAGCGTDRPADETRAEGYLDRGSHGVGYQKLQAMDASGHAHSVSAWFPVAPLEDGDPDIEYAFQPKFEGWPEDAPVDAYGHAQHDAAIASTGASFPLVVFSHGFSLNPEWYGVLLEHVASHGFLVLAPEHAESDWLQTVVDASFTRPADVSRAIDLAEELSGPGGAFEGRIDLERVAVVGHSYGGYTALASAGARLHPRQFAERCDALDEGDPRTYLCAPFTQELDALTRSAGLDDAPETWPSLGDARVKAIVPIAGDAYLFGEAGLAQVRVPIMAIGGTADQGTPWEWGAALTHAQVASEHAALVGFEGADHMIAASTCADLPFVSTLPEEFERMLCDDPAWGRAEALQLLSHFTTAFLRDVLLDDPDARAALTPPNAERFAGIEYTAKRR